MITHFNTFLTFSFIGSFLLGGQIDLILGAAFVLTVLFLKMLPFKGIAFHKLMSKYINTEVKLMLSGKTSSQDCKSSFFFMEMVSGIFLFLLFFNMMGLNVFVNQLFMGKLSTSLLFCSLTYWLSSYLPFIFQKKEKFSLFLVGGMGAPILSFLLSNIEILTHLFRPITLTARLWVNIWIGHLLLSSLSTICFMQMGGLGFFLSFFCLGGFFLFESGIMSLQAFVFSYLISVYWQENMEHSSSSF